MYQDFIHLELIYFKKRGSSKSVFHKLSFIYIIYSLLSGTTIHDIFIWIICIHYEKNSCYTCWEILFQAICSPNSLFCVKTSAVEWFRRKGTMSAWNLFYKCPQTIRISFGYLNLYKFCIWARVARRVSFNTSGLKFRKLIFKRNLRKFILMFSLMEFHTESLHYCCSHIPKTQQQIKTLIHYS